MIRLLGTGKNTLWRIWNGMTITNTQSNTGVATSSTAWNGWCDRHPILRILFSPLPFAVSAIRHKNSSILQCTLRTGGGKHRSGEMPEDDDMLTDVKSTLRVGDTLVPLIFMSDRTYLSAFAGDKKDWPVFVTIGNLSLRIRQMSSTHGVVMVALLPIPSMNYNIAQKWQDQNWKTNRAVLNELLPRVLHLLTFKQNPCADSRYYNVLCSDGNFRDWKLILSTLLEDCLEYTDQHHPEWHVCLWCECPKHELGDYVPADKQYRRQDHNLYRTLSDDISAAVDNQLILCHIYRGFNVFQHIPCIVSDLPNHDLLHTMQLGMLDHQKWI